MVDLSFDSGNLNNEMDINRLSQHELRKIFDYVKSKVSLLDFAKRMKLSIDGYPSNNLCWFHDESNPSARIKLNKGMYYCYAMCGCGDLFWVVRKYFGYASNYQALNWLNKEFSLGLENVELLLTIARKVKVSVYDPWIVLAETLVKVRKSFLAFNVVYNAKLPYWMKLQYDSYMYYIWGELDDALLDLRKGSPEVLKVKLEEVRKSIIGFMTVVFKAYRKEGKDIYLGMGDLHDGVNKRPTKEEIFRVSSNERATRQVLGEFEEELG